MQKLKVEKDMGAWLIIWTTEQEQVETSMNKIYMQKLANVWLKWRSYSKKVFFLEKMSRHYANIPSYQICFPIEKYVHSQHRKLQKNSRFKIRSIEDGSNKYNSMSFSIMIKFMIGKIIQKRSAKIAVILWCHTGDSEMSTANIKCCFMNLSSLMQR